jgi:hypothetical protein
MKGRLILFIMYITRRRKKKSKKVINIEKRGLIIE